MFLWTEKTPEKEPENQRKEGRNKKKIELVELLTRKVFKLKPFMKEFLFFYFTQVFFLVMEKTIEQFLGGAVLLMCSAFCVLKCTQVAQTWVRVSIEMSL